MTPGPLETYLSRLGDELRHRGLRDARIIGEARDHLVDAIDDGMRQGLSREAAEREAFVRFGAPEIVASVFAAERHPRLRRWPAVAAAVDKAAGRIVMFLSREAHMTPDSNGGSAGRLAIVWHRKWWIFVPTLVTAVMTGVVSWYVLPTRYRSEASIVIVPQRVSAEYVHSPATGQVSDRPKGISDVILSQTRLERIIADLDLYEAERKSMPMSDVIRRMRSDIRFTLMPDRTKTDAGGFKVSFASSNPRAALRGTERLASLVIEENLRASEVLAEGSVQFISAQLEEVKRQIIGYENGLDQFRTQAGGGQRPSRTDVLEYEVLQETYKALLTKSQESKVAANLERRQIGVTMKVVDSARLPETPVGPSHLSLSVMGGFAGLVLGLVFVGASARRRP